MHDDLKNLNARRRQYAPFFESLTKEDKEIIVAEEFAKSINAASDLALTGFQLQKPGPPDFVCSHPRGARIGLETTELVSEEPVRRNAKGEDVMRVWHPGDLSDAIADWLRAKDGNNYHGVPFDRLYVCLSQPSVHPRTPALSPPAPRVG